MDPDGVPWDPEETARPLRLRYVEDFRRLTSGSRVSVVSLEIPGIVVSLEIPVFRIFLVKSSGKIVNIGFLDSRDQDIFEIFKIFLYDPKFSKQNKHFAPRICFWPEIRVSDQIKHAIG